MAGQRFLTLAAGVKTLVASLQSSAGAGDAGKIVSLDSSGKLDISMMPTGVGNDASTITASETIASGAIVNIFNSSGVKVRNADASGGIAKMGVGFVLAGGATSASLTVYKEGTITGLSGLTVGVRYFLDHTTPGAIVEAASLTSTAGHIVQCIGYAMSATELVFEPDDPTVI